MSGQINGKSNGNQFTLTNEMIARGLEFFERTSVSTYAPETTYPDFVVDLLKFSLFGEAPWGDTPEAETLATFPFE